MDLFSSSLIPCRVLDVIEELIVASKLFSSWAFFLKKMAQLSTVLARMDHTFSTLVQESSIYQTCTISEMTKFENVKQKQKLSLLEPEISTTKSSTFLTEYTSTIQDFSIEITP